LSASRGGGSSAETIIEQHANAALLVTFVCYPTTSTTLFRIFQCKAFDDGTSALVADLAVECDTLRHAAHKAIAALRYRFRHDRRAARLCAAPRLVLRATRPAAEPSSSGGGDDHFATRRRG
jgi:hypothetical protein